MRCAIKTAFTVETSSYLEYQFYREDTGEDEVEVVEDDVTRRALVDRVLGSQSDAAGADDDHNEQIEVAKIDDEMTESTNSTDTNEMTNYRPVIVSDYR